MHSIAAAASPAAIRSKRWNEYQPPMCSNPLPVAANAANSRHQPPRSVLAIPRGSCAIIIFSAQLPPGPTAAEKGRKSSDFAAAARAQSATMHDWFVEWALPTAASARSQSRRARGALLHLNIDGAFEWRRRVSRIFPGFPNLAKSSQQHRAVVSADVPECPKMSRLKNRLNSCWSHFRGMPRCLS
jgi:hypothetical protein